MGQTRGDAAGGGVPDETEIAISLVTDVRIDLISGDIVSPLSESQDRLLLAGLGPLRFARKRGESAVLLETTSGERWLVRISTASGLVSSLEYMPATSLC